MAPAARIGRPRGARTTQTPAEAQATRATGAAAFSITAKGSADSASSGIIAASRRPCAGARRPGSGRSAPASVSGTIARLTSGIAKALATGETTETSPKSAARSGHSARVTATCVITAPRDRARRPGAQGEREEDGAHGGEGEPEPGRQDRPGIEPQHRQQPPSNS